MPYKYKAYTIDKKVVQGRLDVATESLAEGALYRAGYQRIISLEEVPPPANIETLIPTLFGVKSQEVVDFSGQLATLIESGVSIITALNLLQGQAARPAMKRIIESLAEEIQGGNSLSQALGQYPQAFSDTYRQVIQASEQAGKLETGLRQAAGYMESQAATKQRIQRAMLYPAFVLLMAVGVTALLVLVALPPLVDLFNSLGAELPWMTQLLLGIADFLTTQKYYLLGAIILIIMSILLMARLPSGKLVIDRLMLKLPAIGPINVERHMHHFCQTTSMLLQAGLRLPQVLDITVQTTGNRVIRRAFGSVRDRLIQGEGLSSPMAESEIFSPLLVEMVVVGEKTGTMDTTLATLAGFYEKRVSRRIDTLIGMIEPALTLIIGLVVIFIALSMITPLYSILQTMR